MVAGPLESDVKVLITILVQLPFATIAFLANNHQVLPGISLPHHIHIPSAFSASHNTNNQNVRSINNPVIGCYFTNWAQYRNGQGKFSPENYQPGLCTHILYAFLGMKEDFTVRPLEWNDESADWAKGQYFKVNALKQVDPQLKTLISIGGWNFGTDPFKRMASSPENRRRFIDSVIPFMRRWLFDGLDIDWEMRWINGIKLGETGGTQTFKLFSALFMYPDHGDRQNFVKLFQELIQAFDLESKSSGRPQLLLTAAVAASEEKIRSGYDVPIFAKYIDYIFLMTYDFHGAWEPRKTDMNAPLYARPGEANKNFNVDAGAKIWVELGMPKGKIIIGVATYGRGWTLANVKEHGVSAPANGPARATPFVQDNNGVIAFYEVCHMLKTGAIRYWQPDNLVPYLVNKDQWFSYDDDESITHKMQWLKKHRFGGAFVWTLDFDDFSGAFCGSGKFPLISAIRRELSGTNWKQNVVVLPPQTLNNLQPATKVGPSIPVISQPAPNYFTAVLNQTLPVVLTTAKPASHNTTVQPQVATTTDTAALRCDDRLHKDPNDCKRFYRCSNDQHFWFNCGPGTVFNDGIQACDFPFNVSC